MKSTITQNPKLIVPNDPASPIVDKSFRAFQSVNKPANSHCWEINCISVTEWVLYPGLWRHTLKGY